MQTNRAHLKPKDGLIASGVHAKETQLTEFNIGAHIGMERSVVVPSVEFIEITAITLCADELTITHRDLDASVYGWGDGMFGLMKPDGEINWGRGGRSTYGIPERESFFHIGTANSYDLTLVWAGVRVDHIMFGNWEFTISGDTGLDAGVFRGYFEGYPTQVTLGATNVEIEIFVGGFDIFQDNPLVLYLADGTTIEPSRREFHD